MNREALWKEFCEAVHAARDEDFSKGKAIIARVRASHGDEVASQARRELDGALRRLKQNGSFG